MKILITGATGLVGKRLTEELFLNGHEDIKILTRNKKKAQSTCPFPVKCYEWDPENSTIEKEAFLDVDVVFHLAGEGVANGRWSKKKKEKILNSRTKGTELIINTIRNNNYKPKKFISASAIGFYGDSGNKILNEESPLGDGYLPFVCKKWEESVLKASELNIRTHLIRIGIVLSNSGGALKKMLPPFKAGVAGRLGSGNQFMSWIHIDDLVAQFIFLMNNDCKETIFNGVSPGPVDNNAFTKILGNVLGRPTIFPLPSLPLKVLFGEMSSILLVSQKVNPENFLKNNFKFKYPQLKMAFLNILEPHSKGEDSLLEFQYVEKPLDEVFLFFSDETNLEKLTPEYLKFKVLGKNTSSIEKNTLINYKLSIHGIPFKWQSKITEFVKNNFFIDEQVKGPYAKWVHTHSFIPLTKGTIISDKVIYKIPFGILGRIFAGYFVKKDLNKIFNYRKKVIKQLI